MQSIGEPPLSPPDDEPDYRDYIDTHHNSVCPICNLGTDSEVTDHYDCGEQVKNEV